MANEVELKKLLEEIKGLTVGEAMAYLSRTQHDHEHVLLSDMDATMLVIAHEENVKLRKELDDAKHLLGSLGDELLLLRYVSDGSQPHAVRRRIIEFFVGKPEETVINPDDREGLPSMVREE